MDNGKRTVGLQKSRSFDEQDILRPGIVKPIVIIPGLVEGPRSKGPRYQNYINRYPVQDDRLPRLYPRPKEPMPILSSSVAAYFESTKNLCPGDGSIPNRDCRVTRPKNANVVRADPNQDQRFDIGPPPPIVSRPKASHTDTRNPEPSQIERVNREQRFEIGQPPPVVQKVKTTYTDLHYPQLPEAGNPNALYTDDASYQNQSKLEEAVRLKRQQMAEATVGLHVSPMPEVVANEERRRVNKLRKKEELRLQMESNPHLARRERMKIFEKKRAQALARIQAKVTERERVEAEARKVAEEMHRLELEAKQRSAEKKQRRGLALERARMNREQQRVQDEQAALVEEAKRRAGCEERLRAAEAARIKALEEARRKADEMELKQKDKPVVMQESNNVKIKKIDSKFLQDDRDEMELLEYQLRRDREIVEQAERLQKATLNENDLRRRISEEDTKKQRAELRKATKSKSLPTLGPKRDQVKDKGRPIWGGNQSRTEYKKMSDRDPNYLRRLQQRKEAKKKSSIPVQVLSRQLTFTVANHEPDPLQTGTPFVLTYQPNPEPRRIVMVHKSTSPRNPLQPTPIPDFYIPPQHPHVIDTYENERCTFKHDSPYMTLTERINVLRSNFLQEYIHNQNPNTKSYNYHEPSPILRQNFIQGQNQAFNVPIRRSQAFHQQVSYDEPVHRIHGPIMGQYKIPEIPSVRAFQDYSIPRRPATTQNEVAERDDLIRYLLNRQRQESTNTSEESRVPMICYTIQLPSKYARISRSLGFKAIVRPY